MQGFLASHHHVLAYLIQVMRTLGWLALAVAVFAPLEHFFSVRKARFFYPGWSTNLLWYFVNSLAPILLLGPPSALLAWAVHSVLPAEITGAAGDLPLWARMVLAMVVGEIGFYWGHRWSHEWPLLWRFHAVHHSAEHIHFLVNTRGHPIDMVFTRLCGLTLLYATGLASPVGPNAGLVPAVVLLVGSLWSYFIHANVRWRLGPLEEVLSSPAFHHWHHTYEDHKDRNFSSMLPVMDRLFGTFYLPKHWPERYGTATPMPQDMVGQLLEPLAPSRRAAQGAESSKIIEGA
jgi:sterol desaturase/sphingolipid hydroxylase (fatty acid hydroxylase superfamily)